MLRRLPKLVNPLRLHSHKLIITESAATQLNKICDPDEYLRVSVGGGGCSGYSYEFDLKSDELQKNDLKFERDGAVVGKESFTVKNFLNNTS